MTSLTSELKARNPRTPAHNKMLKPATANTQLKKAGCRANGQATLDIRLEITLKVHSNKRGPGWSNDGHQQGHAGDNADAQVTAI